jgi:hypothetical protein
MILNGPEMDEMLSENSQLQLRWDRAMCKQLGLPLGYGRVSVLLVKWNEDEDEFKKTGEEVSYDPYHFFLRRQFRIRYIFDVHTSSMSIIISIGIY